jgi:glycosyltransferase involved in cell wall biosynthesis
MSGSMDADDASASGNRPYVSLVVPMFNKQAQAPRLLENVLGPSDAADIEVILVDDCSTDGTLSAVNPFVERDKRVKLARLERNSGVHAARNAGMRLARGTWVGFIDGDDYLLKDGLHQIRSTLRSLEVSHEIVFFPFQTSDTGEKTGYSVEGELGIATLISGKAFRREKNCLGFVKRTLLEESGATWYCMNLDQLFWREIELKAKSRKVFSAGRVVGVYDKGTEGSLGKLRRRPEYFLRHANSKVEAIGAFLTKMRPHLDEYPGYAFGLFIAMIQDLKYARNKSGYFLGHVKLMKSYRLTTSLFIRYLSALLMPIPLSLALAKLKRSPGGQASPGNSIGRKAVET